jgi:hypothetical protein
MINLTFQGLSGEFGPIEADTPEHAIRSMLEEALRNPGQFNPESSGIPGIPIQANADLSTYVVDPPVRNAERNESIIFVRPKTAYGLR